MRFPYGVTVTVRRPGGHDKYGNQLPADEHTVADCVVSPGGSAEPNAFGVSVEWDLDLMCSDPDVNILASDEVLLPGDDTVYQVYGRPRRYVNPFTGWRAGCVVHLKGVQG
jgi:hypothetical protein